MRKRLSSACILLLLFVAVLSSDAQFTGIGPITLKPAQASPNQTSGDVKVYRVGRGVTAPRVITAPNPAYTEEARKAKYQGTVILWLIVDANGVPRDVKVARALDRGLDEKAIEAVQKWRFQPATKDGQPVAVQINMEVNFRLY